MIISNIVSANTTPPSSLTLLKSVVTRGRDTDATITIPDGNSIIVMCNIGAIARINGIGISEFAELNQERSGSSTFGIFGLICENYNGTTNIYDTNMKLITSFSGNKTNIRIATREDSAYFIFGDQS